MARGVSDMQLDGRDRENALGNMCKGEKTAKRREFVTGQEQRERSIYTSGESPSKVSGMLRGPLNFETWIPSSRELWNGKAFITTAVALLFPLGEERQDRFL